MLLYPLSLRFVVRTALLLPLLAVLLSVTHAQLAITEVMAEPSVAQPPASHTDFWELTNFGTNTINLAGYSFSDAREIPTVLLPGNAQIHPRESIVFVRQTVGTSQPEAFREWWGACLGSNVQVFAWQGPPGFASQRDGVRLFDPQGELVEAVDFAEVPTGVTLTYATNTGAFGVLSDAQAGACQAAIGGDIGSPGTTAGAVPLQIVQQPQDATVCPGLEAVISVGAIGMPRPKFQWYFNQTAITGATSSILVLSNVSAAQAGVYAVQVQNGLDTLVSSNATLTVPTTPAAPVILDPPSNLGVYAGQTARFSVTACAVPAASYQWSTNGVPVLAATNRSLVLSNMGPIGTTLPVCVEVHNVSGSTNVCAELTIIPKPQLRFTELMLSTSAVSNTKAEWAELTNTDTNTLDLFALRVSDRMLLASTITIQEHVLLPPGASAILLAGITPAEFAAWWGSDRLPLALPVLAVPALQLSQTGGSLFLWNMAAEDPFDVLDAVSYASLPADASVYWDPNCSEGCTSVIGTNGAFQAAIPPAIASPGCTENPIPRFLRMWRDGNDLRMAWRAVPGQAYQLLGRTNFIGVDWQLLSTHNATSAVQVATFSLSTTGERQWFFRLKQFP